MLRQPLGSFSMLCRKGTKKQTSCICSSSSKHIRVHVSPPFILSHVVLSVSFRFVPSSSQSAPSQTRELINMLLMGLALVVAWATTVSGLMQLINPPPFGTKGEFSDSETYNVGSTVNVAWTSAESGKAASLVLY
jgi:hypothetical protein